MKYSRQRTGRPPTHAPQFLDAHRPAVLVANGLGDCVLALPALRALHTLFPGRLSLVTVQGYYRAFFHDLPWRNVHEVEMALLEPGAGRSLDAPALAEAVGQCDGFMSVDTWDNSWLRKFLHLLAPSWSIGLGPSFGVMLPVRSGTHAFDRAFAVPRFLKRSLDPVSFSHPPDVGEDVRRQAAELLDLLPAAARLLVVHADTARPKRFPADNLDRILSAFLEEHPDFVALAVGVDDLGLERRATNPRILSLCGLPIPVSMCIVGAADLFLGVDSLFLHVADLCRVPGVGLFGPTDPAEWGFRFAPARALVGDGGRVTAINEGAILDELQQATSRALTERGVT